jgi:myosin heavy subunit
MKELLEKLSKGETSVDDVLKAIDEANKEMVPRSRLNDKIDEIKELQKQINERDNQLKDLSDKAKGNEDLQKQINELQDLNKQTAKEYQEKLEKQAFDFSLEKALSEAKAKNPKAVKALLNTEAIKLDGEKLLGLEEQLKALQESDSYLFGDGEPAGLKGRKPNDNNQPPANVKNPFSKEHFNLTEQARLYKEDPELYRQLKAQA